MTAIWTPPRPLILTRPRWLPAIRLPWIIRPDGKWGIKETGKWALSDDGTCAECCGCGYKCTDNTPHFAADSMSVTFVGCTVSGCDDQGLSNCLGAGGATVPPTCAVVADILIDGTYALTPTQLSGSPANFRWEYEDTTGTIADYIDADFYQQQSQGFCGGSPIDPNDLVFDKFSIEIFDLWSAGGQNRYISSISAVLCLHHKDHSGSSGLALFNSSCNVSRPTDNQCCNQTDHFSNRAGNPSGCLTGTATIDLECPA